MAKTKSDSDLMNRLYKEYGLTKDHIFKHQHYTIITRQGIDKIQAAANIVLTFEPIDILCDATKQIATFLVKGAMVDKDGNATATIETTGEASPANNKNGYFVAMAEKRGMARAVLKLAGLYEEGVFSEDESDDFKSSVNTQRFSSTRRSEYKSA